MYLTVSFQQLLSSSYFSQFQAFGIVLSVCSEQAVVIHIFENNLHGRVHGSTCAKWGWEADGLNDTGRDS